jgi:hypothetical protein
VPPEQSPSVRQRCRETQAPAVQVWFAAQAASLVQVQVPLEQVKPVAQSPSAAHSGRRSQRPDWQTWPSPHSPSLRQMGPQAPRRQR